MERHLVLCYSYNDGWHGQVLLAMGKTTRAIRSEHAHASVGMAPMISCVIEHLGKDENGL